MEQEDFRKSFVNFLKHLDKADLSDSQRLSRLSQIYRYTLTFFTDQARVQFTSLFSRLSYIINSYDISGKDSFLLHTFRRFDISQESFEPTKYLEVGQQCINIIGEKLMGLEPFYSSSTLDVYNAYFKNLNNEVTRFYPLVSVFIKEINSDEGYLIGQKTAEPFDVISISINRPDRNEDFATQFRALVDFDRTQIHVHLINVELDKEGTYHPESFVFEPDFLFDVTAISECFGSRHAHELGYILRRFINRSSGSPLIIGNIANYFLDQLIYRPELDFDDVKHHIFQLDPLGLALLDDDEVRKMMQMLKRHFYNLKRVINQDFVAEGILKNKAFIEPAFYSAKYGLQGRLDLFVKNEDTASIVELKSGSPFMVNQYGLSNNHYHQTLLYDMLIESVYGQKLNRKNFILYSKELGNNLRYAPGLKSQQRETIKQRNQLYLTDLIFQQNGNFFHYIKDFYKKNEAHIKGYQKGDLDLILKVLSQLSEIELSYVESLISFVVNEHRLSKLGDDSKERLSGLASLWKDSLESKIEQFNIINHLTISSNKTHSDDPILIMKKSTTTAELSNFRIGDLAVLYRDQEAQDSILKDQVFKCVILENTKDTVKVRLRSRQENSAIFANDDHWNLEHDNLDNGFHSMTRSIFEFAESHADYRTLMMGARPPEQLVSERQLDNLPEMTTEQNMIFSRIINSKEYYLLWGPPGTGKTSVLLKNLVIHFHRATENKILLLSYTNRAVDEICHALRQIEGLPQFIRIGSRYSTAEEYVETLLDQQLNKLTNRKQLVSLLSDCRIYVGTVASVMGKSSLFDLIDFDIALVDEASQILDASLIGMLSRVKRFVLIGDHLQLPAVVLQDYYKTKSEDQNLRELGITNLSNSLFERLFLNAYRRGWHHAYGQLSYQGRMHKDLMSFPNDHFYSDSLFPLPGLDRLGEHRDLEYFDHLSEMLSKHRLIYIPCPIDIDSDNIKVNEHEADIVVNLLECYEKIYEHNDQLISTDSIGVITPYRAQIARILKNIELAEIDMLSKVTVDTVERYQGGARDIIILSATVNFLFQMNSLISESEEGIDRKLNVAFTRAREQFILIGNEEILRRNKVYADLIDRCYRLEISL